MKQPQPALFDDLYRDRLTPEAEADQAARRLARRGDSERSKQAALAQITSGRQLRQSDIAAALVLRYPGKTSKELAALTDRLDRVQLARILPQVAKEDPARVYRVEGPGELRWMPTAAALAQTPAQRPAP